MAVGPVRRKRFLAFSFLATTTGLLVLYVSTSLWHFWVASMLFTPSFISGPVGSALVTDLVPQESLVRALAVYSATTWLGGIAGCAITGCATQCFGMSPILLAGTCLARWLSACWLLRGDPGGLEWNQYPCREGCCRK